MDGRVAETGGTCLMHLDTFCNEIHKDVLGVLDAIGMSCKEESIYFYMPDLWLLHRMGANK